MRLSIHDMKTRGVRCTAMRESTGEIRDAYLVDGKLYNAYTGTQLSSEWSRQSQGEVWAVGLLILILTLITWWGV